eukprot:12114564-Alexandrium_andersonii.AAC.1
MATCAPSAWMAARRAGEEPQAIVSHAFLEKTLGSLVRGQLQASWYAVSHAGLCKAVAFCPEMAHAGTLGTTPRAGASSAGQPHFFADQARPLAR